MLQRRQRADHAEHRRERVADRDADAHRRAIGIARDVAHAAHRLADGAEARPVAVGSGLAEAREPHHDQPGLSRREALVAEAPFLQRAGAEVLHHDVGRAGQACARSPGLRVACRLTATDFLLRDCAYHHSELPSWSLRHLRSGSPSPGVSTLTTSAPNSARRRAQYGPAISVPSSTTLIPASGPANAVAPYVERAVTTALQEGAGGPFPVGESAAYRAAELSPTAGLWPGPRTALPGFAPVCWPLSITSTPFTSVDRNPFSRSPSCSRTNWSR